MTTRTTDATRHPDSRTGSSSVGIVPPSPIADPPELLVLLGYLRRVREAIVAATEGLSDDVLRSPGVPTGTNLLGIAYHLAGVEEHWLQYVFVGEDVEVDKSMQAPDDWSRGDVIAAYRAACARSDEIAQRADSLSTPAVRPNPGEHQRDSLRVILTHMIEETARHAGHADILREQIDGATAR